MRYARLPSVALLVFCGWFAAGCVNDENGLSIVHFLHRDTMNNCVADPASMLLESSGILDVALAQQTGVGYLLSPVLANNLIVSTATTSPVNTIFVTGFDVELRADPADTAVAAALSGANNKFHLPAAGGAIFPSGGGAAMASSELALTLEVINADVVQLLQNTVGVGMRDPLALMVHLRPVGTHSGVVINGGYVDFPVFVCKDCLLLDAGTCPVAASDVPQVCNPAQDGTPCCVSGSSLLCGAQLPTKM